MYTKPAVKLQALIRGFIVRRRYLKRIRNKKAKELIAKRLVEIDIKKNTTVLENVQEIIYPDESKYRGNFVIINREYRRKHS